ncbi:low specificity L-threonine aldolase [Saccharibacillus sp. O23]|uniref:threonine aldolase family protein n=1 Tax=Saccharibacillus sp. O23 TaxID=2009338 RepID=UPI000B4E7B4E|nr:aminotransferase class I/II-fold pyridoxal phosphate-dependent enzyme [Saccharibacillus sp. O23]OWR31969.1 low specificity L-threonine aldolase [Saccharibacillus sp. O23]
MTRFECDYTQGAHPRIMQRLMETNMEQTSGYGTDEYCERARDLIRSACEAPEAAVHFLVGGTQTNTTVIAALLRPHQGVLSAETGHIAGHETGAIEATGHKVLTLPSGDGKITAEQVRRAYDDHWNDATHEHIAQPGMVYISQSTENGTVYSLAELEALSAVCRELSLPLFVDGARLGYALAAEGSDVTLADLARLTDVFYIGGTKVGALMGEAVVILNEALKRDFRYLIKQRGGMLAKGRLLGIQFETLFEDGLYMEVSRSAVSLAIKLRDALSGMGFGFLHESPTNQQFPILPNDLLKRISEKHTFSTWAKIDEERTAVRFCTSWGTTEAEIDGLIADLAAAK